jgi:hypothetical protein
VAFFDPTDADDLALLPPALRTSPDLTDLVPLVEADVLAHYTVVVEDVPTVALRGFSTSDPSLVLALKRTTADVLSWRAKTMRKDPLTKREAGRDKSTDYRDDVAHPFPPHFDRLLFVYDMRAESLGLV